MTLLCAAVLAIVFLWLGVAFGRALFSNTALETTLVTAASATLAGVRVTRADLLRPRPPNERQDTGIKVVNAWNAAAEAAPELIVTATDLGTRRAHGADHIFRGGGALRLDSASFRGTGPVVRDSSRWRAQTSDPSS